MFEFHRDKERYFKMQKVTASDHVIPFINSILDLNHKKTVLEIGCAEAGVLKAFTEMGHQCVGIELNKGRVEIAKNFFPEELKTGQIRFIVNDIMKIDIESDVGHQFDLIILKDVIEHIPNQDRFIERLRDFLKPEGLVFFGFPPWYMPFGGHQQIVKNKILSKLPYYHLLPRALYKLILKTAKESPSTINELLEIKDTGISIERFQRLVQLSGFVIVNKQLFLTNPIYKHKFGLKTRKQLPILDQLPFFRNFVTTCAYYLIQKNEFEN